MRKSFLIIATVVITFCLTAFGFIYHDNPEPVQRALSCNKTVENNHFENIISDHAEPEFSLDVGPRFITRITKAQLSQAKQIVDLVPEKATRGIESFWSTRIVFRTHEADAEFEKGDGNELNAAQLTLLQSADYSTNFCIEAYCKRRNPESGQLEIQCFVVYVTVIPEQEAEYESGHDSLLKFLKDNSREAIVAVPREKLEPGKVYFTVNKNGTIENVKVVSDSGFGSVDEKMVELISNMPGKWRPAQNSIGEKVDQELVLFYGGDDC
ncbi:MAG: hypothetical protein DWQ02_19295 [Bacteroidetes bacterium]|nr:MAG: hypothetical protein DWQ02_19295 [Bacteroidota bacterium]